MAKPRWYERLLETTRGQILALLRAEARTVSEMAGRLELSGNAVRRHLTALERDGLVESPGVRRDGVGKPARVYRLTDEALDYFPRAYGTLLNQLLTTLEERRSPAELGEVLQDVGRDLAAEVRGSGFPSDAPLADRVERVARFLEEIGGMPRVEQMNGGFRIVGASCPLEAVVREHPDACVVARVLLEDLLETPVVECCRRNGRPRCTFDIPGEGTD